MTYIPTRSLAIDDLYRLALPADPALHPDGDRVVYTLVTQDADNDRATHALWEVGVASGEPRRLTEGPADSAPRWSPHGSVLAFLRGGDGPAQIHLAHPGDPEAKPLTDLPLGAGVPVWSPDGTRIAFAAPVSPNGRPDPTAPRVIDRADHTIDGLGPRGDIRVHLHVVDVTTGAVTRLTHGEFDAGPPAWSPDGTEIAFPAAIGPDADLSAASAAYVVRVGDAPGEPRLVGSDTGRIGPLGWYPDGTALLAVGTVTLRAGLLRLLRIPLGDGATVDLAADLDRGVIPGGSGYPGALPVFVGDDILFCARDRGASRLYRIQPGGTARELPLPPRAGVAGCSVSARTGRAAIVLAETETFGEIAIVDLADDSLSGRTTHTVDALPDVRLKVAQEREFTISDGTRVHGFVLRDPDAPVGGPLLVDLHGGPHNAWSPHADPFHPYHQELAARGWTILTLNIRGSDGYGEEFHNAALGAWGLADEHDVLEPVATLVAEGLADPARIALTGYSYGGYLSTWLSARSDVFAAVVPGGVVTDLRTMPGTSDSGHIMVDSELIGGDRLVPLSPITHVAGVRAPTLILHGASDHTCPASQAEGWFHALRERGLPVRMVLYPGESHLFILNGLPSHRADYAHRLVEWVERYTDPARAAAAASLEA
ncbi:S9 family peptidase [Embleya sp. NBC_00896]|uniref:S9 family peptidase n=1 Tax=Embleya sp. NBC_00896 TaxID=2975961 RepID=UPI003867A651|nr:S9 family peptidase [Embleya sp. NBC_00896]